MLSAKIHMLSAKIHYNKMAGKFGAIICKTSSFPGLYPLYKPTHTFFPRLHKSVFCNHNFTPFRSSYSSRNFNMAAQQDPQSNSPEIKEPSPKIAKLDQTSGAGEGTKKVVDNDTLLRFKKLSENAFTPVRGSPFSAGYDLSSATDIKVPARGKALVPTDLSIGIPKGTYARIAPRSGLAWKHSIDVGAGVIDYDYRGPVGVILFNHSDRDFEIKLGDRIAQVIIEKIVNAQVVEVEELDLTYRGDGGFGSTGI